MTEQEKQIQDAHRIPDRKEKTIIRLTEIVKARESELKDCVNELCYRCGKYRNEHCGACKDCRWWPIRNGGTA